MAHNSQKIMPWCVNASFADTYRLCNPKSRSKSSIYQRQMCRWNCISWICLDTTRFKNTFQKMCAFLHEHLKCLQAQGANAFVLVYDVTNMESFKSLPKWIAMIKKSRAIKGPMAGVVLANKVDQTTRRVVTTAQGEEFARQTGLGFFECSAVCFSIH